MSREKVSNISFPDLDLDESEIGGTLSGVQPTTTGSHMLSFDWDKCEC